MSELERKTKDLSVALQRLCEQQALAYSWRDKFENLTKDYEDLCMRYEELAQRNLQMNVEIVKKSGVIWDQEETIAFLEKRTNDLETGMTSQSFTTSEHVDVETVSAPADLCDWATLRSSLESPADLGELSQPADLENLFCVGSDLE